MILRVFCLTQCALILICLSSIAQAGVINGQFEDGGDVDPFDDWSTDPFLGYNSPTASKDVSGNRFVKFGDSGSGSQLAQVITIPLNADSLSFDFQLMTNGPTNMPNVPDGFLASLLDNNFLGVLSAGSDPLSQPAFFVIDDGSNTLPMLPDMQGLVSLSTVGTGLPTGWSRVSLDISSLAPQSLLLEFILFNNFDVPDVDTMVFLDNVVVSTQSASVVPEPTSLAIFAGVTPLLLVFRRRKFKALVNAA